MNYSRTHSAFLTLQELAQKSVDDAAIKLKKADDNYHNAQQQLNELKDYYLEYQQRLQYSLTKGVKSGDLTNLHVFIGTLEKSISLQQQQLLSLSIKQKQATQHLFQCQKKLNGYKTLLEKKHLVLLEQQNRLQQKLTDEFAQQQSVRRTMYES